ncbi:UMP kinase [Thermogladius sp.]|uniref:UMP kinase n=1 Tax=Thermogladius sp. TaxID=2023064 RepID=UPI003D0F603F
MDTVVVKVTGKIFDDQEALRRFVEVVRELARERRVVVVAGGGRAAREAIERAKSIGVSSNYWLDEIGIEASRLNALILVASLQPLSYPGVPRTLGEVMHGLAYSRVVVLGGLVPGQSTAAVLLEVAEAVGAREVYDLSAADYVYDKDPRTSPDARPLKVVEASKLAEWLKAGQVPGDYALLDLRALDIAVRSRITIKIASYKNPGSLIEMMRGGNPGSTVIPE